MNSSRSAAVAIERVRAFEQPDLENLARVVPLVHRVADVEAFVALQADQFGVERRRQHLGDFGLADAGFALEEQRPLAAAARGRSRPRGRARRRTACAASASLQLVDAMAGTDSVLAGAGFSDDSARARRGRERALDVDRRHRARGIRPTRT